MAFGWRSLLESEELGDDRGGAEIPRDSANTPPFESGGGGLSRGELSPDKVGQRISRMAIDALDAVSDRTVARSLLGKLKSGKGVCDRPYPANLGARRDINLQRKSYLGNRSLYLFEEDHASIFDIRGLMETVDNLQLSEDEITFIAQRCFCNRYRPRDVQEVLMFNESGVLSVLLGVVNALYGSASSELGRCFGSEVVIERELEKAFAEPLEEKVA
ncbi:MAG: hypothetical protein WCX95_02370 [Candidatus Gracilibacteria bacterium]